ncbi:MAG TPA: hypothetical protein VKR43_14270 [Bryobacteraceae bacterium]|nr:hypothetical protein [Bryobacteraceae bacterium]
MRYPLLIAAVGVSLVVSLAAQDQPNCTGITLQVDVRCACIKDPHSQQCDFVKAGVYGPHDFSKMKGLNGGLIGAPNQPAAKPAAKPAQPQQARVVPLAHKDYLRFLQPNAQVAAGFDFSKVFQSPELMAALFGQTDSDSQNKVVAALKEMDHLWFGFTAPSDFVLVMTGKFEQGAAAGMFYSQGIRPVFLADAHAMMIGPEPAVQAALARLAKPLPAPASMGWAARRSRELAKDHETWIVTEPPAGAATGTSPLAAMRRFALGFRLTGEGSLDGEVVADSEANAEKMGAWVEQMKSAIREKTGVGALDSLTVERAGTTLRFTAKGDSLLAGDAGKKAVSSDFGVELYSAIAAGFPGMQTRTVAADKLLSVKEGMKKDEVVSLLGPPLSVSAIQGLDTPRETWTYQVPFGKQLTLRLDNGIVTSAPR